MKKLFCLTASLFALNLAPIFAQPLSQPLPAPRRVAPLDFNDSPELAKFSLDFPGGTPKELVAAIEKASGKPLNAIIADDDASTKLPPIKVSDVNVASLFKTLSENSKKYANNELIRSYGFQTLDAFPSDNSLWTFYSQAKPKGQTAFNLDFPGGTPAQMVQAIEKAMNKSLNVIINKEDENVELPALKMNDVYLPQLFAALGAASRKNVAINNPGAGFQSYSSFVSGYGFKSADGGQNDNSVWYFYVDKPSLPPVVSSQKSTQFYSLAPYLDRGFTVDDITTAIQTGWKMAGETTPPELNYHKETRLLIAFGEPRELQTIQNVLGTLPSSNATRNEINNLWGTVRELQKKLEDLKKPAAAPEEKSGK